MTSSSDLVKRLREEVIERDKFAALLSNISNPRSDNREGRCAQLLEEAINCIEALEADLAKLSDPNAVHASMLYGSVAKISMLQCAHTHGEEMVKRWNSLEALEAENAKLESFCADAIALLRTSAAGVLLDEMFDYREKWIARPRATLGEKP